MRPKPFQRVCSVCKNSKNKFELIRLVKKEGTVELDLNFCFEGRGAYICKECAAKLKQNKGLNKAFRCNIPNEIYDKISCKIKEN